MKKLLLSVLLLLWCAPAFGAVACDNEGALAVAGVGTTLSIVSDAGGWAAGDILIAAINNKDNQQITAPGAQGAMGAWTIFAEGNNTADQRFTLAWARATGADIDGDTFVFTKPVDNSLLFAGVIFKCTGVLTSGDPLDATAESVSPNAVSDTVTYATYDPTETSAYVVAIGVYADNLVMVGTISGTDPTLTLFFSLETAVGTDAAIFGFAGSSSGAATGERSHATSSSADAVNTGVMFGLVEQPAGGCRTVGGLLGVWRTVCD